MKQSSSTDNMIFFIYLASTETHLGLSLICDLWLLNKNSIQLNWNLLKMLPFCPYHFVRTILSNTILSSQRSQRLFEKTCPWNSQNETRQKIQHNFFICSDTPITYYLMDPSHLDFL